MKITTLKFHTLLLCGALAFTACKKNKDQTTNPPQDNSQAQEATASTDHSDYLMFSDQMTEEANLVVSGTHSTQGATSGTFSLILGSSVDTSQASAHAIFKITYNGASSAGYSRSGWDSIWVVAVGNNWSTIGAEIIQKYDYTVTKSNGKTMRIVGRDTTWNVNGGSFFAMLNGSIQTTDHSGTATITFDDGTQRTWSHARRKVRSYSNGLITTTVTGNKNASGSSMIDIWGINRSGETFYAEITTALVWKYSGTSQSSGSSNSCTHWYEAISGMITYKGSNSGLMITYGVDSAGNLDTSNTTCPYGYKVNWTNQGQLGTKIYAY